MAALADREASDVVPFRPQAMIYGGDYNPEQWGEETWEEDARLMREAGVNLVSLGIFAWARIEPRPGTYDFAWLDRVIELLVAQGVQVNLATATAAPPPWLARMHPEILPVTAEGVRLSHGSRRHYCPSSAAYREHAARLVRAIAGRYRAHPAVVLWHVDNEYGCHIHECFCDACAAAFRGWLRARHGSLPALNSAWGSAFWGQIYGEWEEIAPPRRAPYVVNPAHQLDWRRFCSDAWLACFEEQRAILRELTPHVPVTTNFMGFFKPLDYWRWAAREDIVANDTYPEPSDPSSPLAGASAHDLMRSLGGGRPWLLMEQVTSHVQWRPRNTTKPPGMMRLWSYQAIARGADGVMFFQWRASRAGAEQFHGAMLPHGGTDTRLWREVVDFGGELRRLAPVLGSRVRAEVAIVLDWSSWWALELEGKPSSAVQLIDRAGAWYAPLFERNIAVDFAHPESDLSRYRLVLAPNLYLASDQAARELAAFVEGGGTLAAGFFSGVVDQNEQVYPGALAAPLRAALGLRVEEWAPYAERQSNRVYTQDEETFGCSLWTDVIALEGAEPLAHYADDFYAHRAAVTRHSYGRGAAYYAGTALDGAGSAWLMERACAEAGVQATLAAPAGVEAVRREAGGHSWLFLLNHGSTEADVALARPGRDLLSGEQHSSLVRLESRGVAIIAEA